LVFGIGTDIIEIGRVEEKLRRTGGLKTRVFTPREITYCEGKAKSAQHYAARFAAKEAFLKAIGTGWSRGYRFVDIEILNNEQGKPQIVLQGKVKDFCEENGITGFHVSLSHIKDLAKAVVVLEKG
jgi:holo-[acyl-carrier protein] synthase